MGGGRHAAFLGQETPISCKRPGRPQGYLVRHVPAEDGRNLAQLSGHLCENQFITKFRKIFARDEMNDDLVMVPADLNNQRDDSEYQEILPTSPP